MTLRRRSRARRRAGTADDRVSGAAGTELRRLLTNLADVARTLSGVTSLEQLLELAAEQVCAGLRAATVSISRLEPGTGSLRTLINVGQLGPTEQRWPADEVYSLQEFLALRDVVNDQQSWTMTVFDDDIDPAELRLLHELGKQAATAAPIRTNGTLWGELYVTYLQAEDVAGSVNDGYMEVYLALLESALTRVLQLESLALLAYRDPLTGLANRRALDEAAEEAWERLADGGIRHVHAVAIDLNGLKQVNDNYGHAEGDRLIVGAAAQIREHFNGVPGALVARTGGDEFAVLVPSHDLDQVAACARSACSAIAALPLGSGASCGIATATDTVRTESAAHLFRRADAAQYRSKRSGSPLMLDLDLPDDRSA